MALFTATTNSSLFFSKTHLKPTPQPQPQPLFPLSFPSLSFTHLSLKNPRFPKNFFSFKLHSSISDPDPTPDPDPNQNPSSAVSPPSITDEWGEKVKPGSEPETTKMADSDPPMDEDEWEEEEEEKEDYVTVGNDSAAHGQVSEAVEDSKVKDLKRCLVDTVYGTELGFRAGSEVRAEVLELVNKLEALNPTPVPVEASGFLDGNWVLV